MKNLTPDLNSTSSLPISMHHESAYSTVRLLLTNSGRGLQVDADLLQKALETMGCQVERKILPAWSIHSTRNSHRYAKVKQLLPRTLSDLLNQWQVWFHGLRKPKVALQIHLESVAVDYMAAATVNWLIPNQEWIRPQHLCFFKYLDRVLVKTEEAKTTLTQHHADVRMLGFSNPIAEVVPEIINDLNRFHCFLHVAGRNRKKGTKAIVEAWRRHPEWPQLEVVIDNTCDIMPVPANVNVWKHPNEEKLTLLRRDNGIVLAPSEVEGYGHILVEGMAFQEVVITTDASPMNELIQPDRGYLLPWHKSEPCHLGVRYFVDADAIEIAVTEVLNTHPSVLFKKSLAARSWVIQNHETFISELQHQLKQRVM